MRIERALGLAALGIGLTLGRGAGAHAGFAFSYTSTVDVATDPTSPAPPANPGGSTDVTIPIGEGNSLEFTTNSRSNIDGSLAGGADINYGNIIFHPDSTTTVVSYAVNFNYTVRITDVDSGDTQNVNFTGQVKGSARGMQAAINSSLFNYAVQPTSFTLGGSLYKVATKLSTGPGSTSVPGVLQGNVSVVPEPASVVLVSLGGIGLLALTRRKLRRPGNRD